MLNLVTSQPQSADFEGREARVGWEAPTGTNLGEIDQDTPRAFTTRRIPSGWLRYLTKNSRPPRPGDLALARVERIGQHKTLHLPNGRRRTLFVGDEIIVSFGDRYAPDQFEARIPKKLGDCHLVASGGVAAVALSWHERMRRPTEIKTLGYVSREPGGQPLSLGDNVLAMHPVSELLSIPVIAVVGTAMNSGKTTVAAHLTCGLRRLGERPAFAKVTGTGSGGDPFLLADAGANPVLDFTDLGYVSTYRLDPIEVAAIFRSLVRHAAASSATVVVVEVADGLYQPETSALLRSDEFGKTVAGVLFAASDSMGAAAGSEWLAQRNLKVLGVTGTLTSAPLQIREAGEATHNEIVRTMDFSDPAVVAKLLAKIRD